MKDLETRFLDIEIHRTQKRELYHISVHHPCRISRGKAGWELYKANLIQKDRQRILINMVDQEVSDQELADFLHSQHLTIH